MRWANLSDLCEINVGRTPARANATYWGSGHAWLSIADMNQGRVLTTTKEQITEVGRQECNVRIVDPGTVVLSFKLSIGKVGIINHPMATNEAIAALPVKNPSVLYSEYLYHALGSLNLAGGANRAAMGATLNKASLAKIQIPLPPLSDQRRIAGILDKADHLRTQRREALIHLDALTQSIFNSMFGNPVSNSAGWRTEKLGNLGKLDRGVSKHRPRNDPRLLGGVHPLIQTGDVANSGGYITEFKSTYSDFGLSQSRLWPEGTLCITIAANIAKTGILQFKACFPDSVVGFTADPSTSVFVQVWMGFLQKIIERNAPESAQKNINLTILRDLNVINPPLELQQIFAERVAGIEKLKEQHRTQLAELDAPFASLQHRAFRGEL